MHWCTVVRAAGVLCAAAGVYRVSRVSCLVCVSRVWCVCLVSGTKHCRMIDIFVSSSRLCAVCLSVCLSVCCGCVWCGFR
jgi:hypothetical protein